MDLYQIRNRYLKFFEKQGHAIVPSASLVPLNDPSTLFTSSGMQPLVPYLLGEKHPLGRRVVNSQKCFRAEDIEEVGDNRHTTFFEMLGNWSLGDTASQDGIGGGYFKKEQIAWFFEFLTADLGLPAERIYVTAFAGEPGMQLPKDTESGEIWKSLFAKKGIDAKTLDVGTVSNGGKLGMKVGVRPDGTDEMARIFYYDAKKNWWSRSGVPQNMPKGEPGGPDTEVFYEFTDIVHDSKYGANCHPNCDCGRFMEIGNSVFMEYKKNADGFFDRLPAKNVDFGGGLERIAAALINSPDIFATDVFTPVVSELGKLSGIDYVKADAEKRKAIRIISDHLRAAVFMSGDGVIPGNKERGYILRRLVRRAVLSAKRLGLSDISWIDAVVDFFVDTYKDYYGPLESNAENIKSTVKTEAEKFHSTLAKGLKKFDFFASSGELSAENIFDLYQSYGFPEELSLEMAGERGLNVQPEEVAKLKGIHRDLSRQASDKKFKGGLADSSAKVTEYHTATHLLNRALKEVLGAHVNQRGSNITALRLRFDFSHQNKMTDEEKKRVEELVNEKIREALPVGNVEMKLEDAIKSGAVGVFGERYPDMVTVYSIGDVSRGYWSREICGGPHVANTSELTGVFKIVKEEAVSQGVRRIRAVLE